MGCCGWVPCCLVSRPFRSRDEFFTVVRSYSIYQLERFTRSNDVLTLVNVYIPLFARISWSCPTYIYILGCTDRFVSPVYKWICTLHSKKTTRTGTAAIWRIFAELDTPNRTLSKMNLISMEVNMFQLFLN